ncbi:hypothetical protein KCP77_16725 [Salmonella enterica subsp. enterica]|nr:hypothetical protein KCP77_16725 [Salmonella enterica subsp. enterica]
MPLAYARRSGNQTRAGARRMGDRRSTSLDPRRIRGGRGIDQTMLTTLRDDAGRYADLTLYLDVTPEVRAKTRPGARRFGSHIERSL